MVTYTVAVHTGDMEMAGTSNTIYLKLVGTEGSSEVQKCRGFSRGSVREVKVTCPNSLGTIVLVELDAKAFMEAQDDWFCTSIVVSPPDSSSIGFPCYCWLESGENLSFRDAAAKLIFKDTNTEAFAQRKKQLNQRLKDFKWKDYGSGLPKIMKADSPQALPAEVRFSYTKNNEFRLTMQAVLGEMKLNGYSANTKSWTSFEDMNQVFSDRRTKTYEYVQKHWKEDEFFGYQFLNGYNPMKIQRCSVLPENFPVTGDMVNTSLPTGSSLTEEMENGNIFLCDYKLLKGLTGSVIHKRQQYLVAPLCLLYSNPEGKMLPIAIQLKQEPGEENPIFLPTDSEHDWLLAKIFVRSAESNEHGLNFHMLRTHLLADVYTIATMRNLPSVHPLYKLLIPHFRFTLQINIMARAQLGENGSFSKSSAMGGEGIFTYMKRVTSSLTYSSLCLPEDIEARGLENVPNYYYRDDGLKLWKIIHSFVDSVVRDYYTTDADAHNDSELQSWINEIYEKGFLGNDDTGIPQSFKSVTEIIKFVTMVIFNVSAQHAAVNNGQYEFGGWIPNNPSALKLPPPTSKGNSTERTILETLPDISTTVQIMGSAALLSKKSSERYPLGVRPLDLFSDHGAVGALCAFNQALAHLESAIDDRNQNLELPYTYLHPKEVDSSVDI